MITASPGLYEYLRWWEGRRGMPVLEAYQDDAKVWTIAYGHTSGVKRGDTVTKEEAEQMLSADVGLFIDGVRFTLASAPEYTQQQFDALVSLAYNIGMPRFRTSSPCLFMKTGKQERVGAAMELWNKVTVPGLGLVVSPGLTRRRAADRAIFDHGDYSGRP